MSHDAVVGEQHVDPGPQPVAGGDQRPAPAIDPRSAPAFGGRYSGLGGIGRVWGGRHRFRGMACIGHGGGDIATGPRARKRRRWWWNVVKF